MKRAFVKLGAILAIVFVVLFLFGCAIYIFATPLLGR